MTASPRILSFNLVRAETSAFLKHECDQAIADILRTENFTYLKFPGASYKIKLAIEDGYLVFHVSDQDDRALPLLAISPRPYKRLIQDYFLMVESYERMKATDPYKLEAIDMARRGIHNEGARLLTERLASKITMDFDTARRFFTLICVLHLKNHQY